MIYINDIGSNIRLFADKTSFYIVVDDPITAANCLNTDLDQISRWAATWLVSVNPAKNKSLFISHKLNRPHHPSFSSLSMQNHQIPEVDSHKHLGIYLLNDCTWLQHTKIILKAWFSVNVMRKLKFELDRKSLEIICTAFIRPLLEYSDIICDNCAEYEKADLDKIQTKAARTATGATKLFSLNTLSNEICLETLEQRWDKKYL